MVRHGQTTWNSSRLVQGHNDEAELTERGRQQVAEVAKPFRSSDFDLIVSSDLRRAVDTAAILADDLGLEVEIDEWHGLEPAVAFATPWLGFRPDELTRAPPSLLQGEERCRQLN